MLSKTLMDPSQFNWTICNFDKSQTNYEIIVLANILKLKNELLKKHY
jgi:hypothetical protein